MHEQMNEPKKWINGWMIYENERVNEWNKEIYKLNKIKEWID